jgi:hypothetical protein
MTDRRMTNSIVEKLLKEQDGADPEGEADDEVSDPFAVAAEDLLTAIQRREPRAFSEALRAVLDLYERDDSPESDPDVAGKIIFRRGK